MTQPQTRSGPKQVTARLLELLQAAAGDRFGNVFENDLFLHKAPNMGAVEGPQ